MSQTLINYFAFFVTLIKPGSIFFNKFTLFLHVLNSQNGGMIFLLWNNSKALTWQMDFCVYSINYFSGIIGIRHDRLPKILSVNFDIQPYWSDSVLQYWVHVSSTVRLFRIYALQYLCLSVWAIFYIIWQLYVNIGLFITIQ